MPFFDVTRGFRCLDSVPDGGWAHRGCPRSLHVARPLGVIHGFHRTFEVVVDLRRCLPTVFDLFQQRLISGLREAVDALLGHAVHIVVGDACALRVREPASGVNVSSVPLAKRTLRCRAKLLERPGGRTTPEVGEPEVGLPCVKLAVAGPRTGVVPGGEASFGNKLFLLLGRVQLVEDILQLAA